MVEESHELTPEIRHRLALLQMRRELVSSVDAVIAIGGKLRTQSGWFPGVLEEVLRNLQACHPVFLCRAFGGVSARLYDALILRDPTAFLALEGHLNASLQGLTPDVGVANPYAIEALSWPALLARIRLDQEVLTNGDQLGGTSQTDPDAIAFEASRFLEGAFRSE